MRGPLPDVLEAVVVGPDDRLVVCLPPYLTRADFDQAQDAIARAGFEGRVLVISGAEELAVLRSSSGIRRWRSIRRGDVPPDRPRVKRRAGLTAEERFHRSYRVDEETGCWVWLLALDEDCYGHFAVAGRNFRAHRWAFEHLVGPIPDGLTVDHLCRHTWCVNPAHMEAVTMGENNRRARASFAEGAQ